MGFKALDRVDLILARSVDILSRMNAKRKGEQVK